jgi:hypothetical protein
MERLCVVLLLVVSCVSVTWAVSLPIVNSGFEEGVTGQPNVVSGWTPEGGNAYIDPDGGSSGSANCLRIVTYTGVSQTLSVPIQENAHYTFQVDIFGDTGQTDAKYYDGNEIYLAFMDSPTTSIGLIYTVNQDVYNNIDLVSYSSELSGLVTNVANTSPSYISGNTAATNFVTNPPYTDNQWYTLRLEWDVPAGSALAGTYPAIILRSSGASSDDRCTKFDNVRLDVVPEPITLFLLGAGMVLGYRKN